MATTKPADDMIRFTEYVPLCGLVMWPLATAPSANVCEWVIPIGQAISRTTYATAFAILGTTYGVGDGSTTFNLPDYRGRFPLCVSGSYAIGSTGGAATHTLTDAEIPAHAHTVAVGGNGQAPVALAGAVAVTGVNTNTGNTGGGGAHNNMPPYATVNFIMRIK